MSVISIHVGRGFDGLPLGRITILGRTPQICVSLRHKILGRGEQVDRAGYRELAIKARLVSGHVSQHPDDEVMGADFQLHRGGGIEGTVRLAGEPLPEVTVSAYDDQGRLAGTIESDAEGRYRIGGLLDGPYFLSAKYRSWTQIYPNQARKSPSPPWARALLCLSVQKIRILGVTKYAAIRSSGYGDQGFKRICDRAQTGHP